MRSASGTFSETARFALALAALVGAAPAFAHDYWLQAEKLQLAENEPLIVHMNLGQALQAEEEKSYEAQRTERFEAANVRGLNFMLYDALAGGASRSLRSDTQGKTFALALLQMPIDVPADHADMLRQVS